MSDGLPGSIGVRKVLVIGTGAISVCHLPTFVTLLRQHYRVDTAVCLTEAARAMVSPAALEVLSGRPAIPPGWSAGSGPIHVEWAQWPDAVLVWPATLHFLASCALGLTADVATSIAVAATVPVVFAPSLAMGVTASGPYRRAAAALQADGRHLVGPIAGHGVWTWQLSDGACAPPDAVLRELARISSGPTEPTHHAKEHHDHHRVSRTSQ
ncbi:flavoprotein [Phytoactinopolyspora limicola]|uniref:flavoprotein n=1 Tax=Phytoactinopolyspora limicola TaxID=2715536 RepID=UPI00140AA7AD|nr:flavoprotein [Phytoactinopolyspora limicola]